MGAAAAAPGYVAYDDDDDDGGGVRKRTVHYAGVESTPSADRCRRSTGSPGRSSYHSPEPPSPRHPLKEEGYTDQYIYAVQNIKNKKYILLSCSAEP